MGEPVEISQHSALYLWRWTLMKNTTRRPPLIIHSAPKQSQQGHLETKVEADSPFTASQHPTLLHPWVPADSSLNNNVLA